MEKQICNRCVMDNVGDDTISFMEDGTCSYCNYALGRMDEVYFPNEAGRAKLEGMIKRLKEEGRTKQYDCLMGLVRRTGFGLSGLSWGQAMGPADPGGTHRRWL